MSKRLGRMRRRLSHEYFYATLHYLDGKEVYVVMETFDTCDGFRTRISAQWFKTLEEAKNLASELHDLEQEHWK